MFYLVNVNIVAQNLVFTWIILPKLFPIVSNKLNRVKSIVELQIKLIFQSNYRCKATPGNNINVYMKINSMLKGKGKIFFSTFLRNFSSNFFCLFLLACASSIESPCESLLKLCIFVNGTSRSCFYSLRLKLDFFRLFYRFLIICSESRTMSLTQEYLRTS